jgi:plasmid stabilization system protein ParE
VPARSVRLRDQAATDIDQAVDSYLQETDTEVALRFVDAVERAIRTLPNAESRRLATNSCHAAAHIEHCIIEGRDVSHWGTPAGRNVDLPGH